MSSLKEFQARHAAEWSEIIGSPAFSAALALAHSERIQQIVVLGDDEIAARGQIILADLRGHLQYEAVLLGLHEKKEFVFQQLGAEEYPDPADEAREEARQAGAQVGEEIRESMTETKGAHSLLFPPAKIIGKPKPKRGRPPKRKKK